ncbi:hypothetical protein P8452_62344 [Trifolium repens]|nr:hypothetical protein P8452_62344 [Trifolium repens]
MFGLALSTIVTAFVLLDYIVHLRYAKFLAIKDITAGRVQLIKIVAMSTLLIFIYNFSDQVLATRERRKAKSREAAAKHLSRTFSRKKSSKPGDLFSPTPPDSSSKPNQSSKAKNKEPSNLTKMMHSIEDDEHEGFDFQIGDKNIKKQMPKEKNLHTHSQILSYAYGQIENEKAQQEQTKNMTFSGEISMAAEAGEVNTRPSIEAAFNNLTLTLKGKNKHVLRCVSGKIMPGRVSAVMGPSVAGKTTFLSALAGKSRGCNISGSILINGKNESIHSYKKITGFVPQDDILHRNLTVEENLRFSARCRLPADMPKPDKVLIVERVIEERHNREERNIRRAKKACKCRTRDGDGTFIFNLRRAYNWFRQRIF